MKDWAKAQPLLAGVLLGSILCAFALIVWGSQLRSGNERLSRQLAREISAWNALAARSPAPTEANVAAATLHLADLEAQRRRLRQGLEAQGMWDPVPEFRGLEDLYFDLVGMVERQRDAYTSAGILLVGEEQFGYGQVVRAQQVVAASNDPLVTEKWIQRLYRQRQAVDAVLTALRKAGPSALRGVERAPLQAVESTRRGGGEDFFTVAPAVTAGVAKTIETYGVRVRFEGKTAVLRAFLEELKSSRRPIVVRTIEVAPATSGAATRRAPARSSSPFASLSTRRRPETEDPTSVPIVADNDSVFTVVLEGFALVDLEEASLENEEGAR